MIEFIFWTGVVGFGVFTSDILHLGFKYVLARLAYRQIAKSQKQLLESLSRTTFMPPIAREDGNDRVN